MRRSLMGNALLTPSFGMFSSYASSKFAVEGLSRSVAQEVLASDEAAYVSGHALRVDGGMLS